MFIIQRLVHSFYKLLHNYYTKSSNSTIYGIKKELPKTSVTLRGSLRCRRADSNRYEISLTAPSRQRVYQFHHFGVYYPSPADGYRR